jgi:hypothetical protein
MGVLFFGAFETPSLSVSALLLSIYADKIAIHEFIVFDHDNRTIKAVSYRHSSAVVHVTFTP